MSDENSDQNNNRWGPLQQRYSWQRVKVNNAVPISRHGHRAVAVHDLIIVFGGGNEGVLNDLHVFNTTSLQWFTPVVQGDVPPPRAAFGFVVDGQRILLYGGMLEYGVYSDSLYELNIQNWKWHLLHPQPPSEGLPPCPRFGHSFTIMGKIVVLFGGVSRQDPEEIGTHSSFRYLNDLHFLDLRHSTAILAHQSNAPIPFIQPKWITPQVDPDGLWPSPRESHSCVAYQSAQLTSSWKLLVFGGMNGSHRLGDLWQLDVGCVQWSEISCGLHAPLPRSLHSANLIGTKMFIFGGWISSEHLRGKSYQDEGTSTVDVDAEDTVEEDHDLQKLTSNMFSQYKWCVTNDLCVFDIATLNWEPVPSPYNFSSVSEHLLEDFRQISALLHSRILKWDPVRTLFVTCQPSLAAIGAACGFRNSRLHSDVPPARAAHCAVSVRDRVYIWSGRDGFYKTWSKQICHYDLWYLETQPPNTAPRDLCQVRATKEFIEVAWSPVHNADTYRLQVTVIGSGTLDLNETKEKSPSASDLNLPSPLTGTSLLQATNRRVDTITPASPLIRLVPVAKVLESGLSAPRIIRLLPKQTMSMQPRNEVEKLSTTGETSVENYTKGGEIWFPVNTFHDCRAVVKGYFTNETGISKYIPLQSRSTYQFRVRAENSVGVSKWCESTETHGCHLSVPSGLPTAPLHIQVCPCPGDGGGYNVVWEPPLDFGDTNAVEYCVHVAMRKTFECSASSHTFERIYQGYLNTAHLTHAMMQRAFIEVDQDTGESAVLIRVLAKNREGFGPAAQLRWVLSTAQ